MNVGEKQDRKEVGEKRESSSTIVTAWQIQSTLKNMEEFIKFIAQFQEHQVKVESVLPFIQKIKRIQDERDLLNKQLLEFNKTISAFTQTDKQQHLLKGLRKQKEVVFKHRNRLEALSEEVKQLSVQNQRKITKLRDRIELQKKKREKESRERREACFKETDHKITNWMEEASKLIISLNSELNIFSSSGIYGSFIDDYVRQKFMKFKAINDGNHTNRQLKVSASKQMDEKEKEFGVQKSLVFEYNQLGEMKCKLLSLQDKKRKITVKNLINHSSTKGTFQSPSISQAFNNKKLTIKSTKNTDKQPTPSHQKPTSKQHEHGILSSFLAIFSSQPKNQQTIIGNGETVKEVKNEKNKRPDNRMDVQQNKELVQMNLSSIEDREVKLRLAEIYSEILELREHINIMINHNIIEQLVGSVVRIRELNFELSTFFEKLVQIVQFINSPERLQNETSLIEQVQEKSSESLFTITVRKNQQVNFFLHFIKDRLNTRHKLIEKILLSTNYSINVAEKFMIRKFSRIQEEQKNFIQATKGKDQKIRAVQALQSKTEFYLINSALEALKIMINQVSYHKLAPLKEIIEMQSRRFSDAYKNLLLLQSRNRVSQKTEAVIQKIYKVYNENNKISCQLKLEQDDQMEISSFEIGLIWQTLTKSRKEKVIKIKNTKDVQTSKIIQKQLHQNFIRFHHNLCQQILRTLVQSSH